MYIAILVLGNLGFLRLWKKWVSIVFLKTRLPSTGSQLILFSSFISTTSWLIPSPPGFKSWCSHLFLDLFQDFRWCAFSGRRRSRQRRGAYGDFVNLKVICRLSLSEVLIGVGMSVCACIWALVFVPMLKKTSPCRPSVVEHHWAWSQILTDDELCTSTSYHMDYCSPGRWVADGWLVPRAGLTWTAATRPPTGRRST